MIVLVDTTIWSLALRRRSDQLSDIERRLLDEWMRLVRTGEAVLIGPIRQEVLSGIRESRVFAAIQEKLGAFRYPEVLPEDYDRAARFFNACRARGITGSAVDLLICAVAHRLDSPIFTTDIDFQHYSKHVRIRLHYGPGLSV